MQKDNTTKLLFVGVAILLISLTRLAPHAPNFTAIGAMAIFGGATLKNKWMAFSIPVIGMLLTDLFINNVMYAQFYDGFQWITPGFGWTMVALAAMVLSGKAIIKKVSALGILGGSVAASLVFFILSNFGVWTMSTDYTKDIAGLILCYEAAVPFLLNTFLGTLVYSSVLFGSFKLASIKLPELAKETVR